jgi:hypothetical protein
MNWRKARRSVSNGACVEVAASAAEGIAVRDSQDPHGLVLAYPAPAWITFLGAARRGDFDPAI